MSICCTFFHFLEFKLNTLTCPTAVASVCGLFVCWGLRDLHQCGWDTHYMIIHCPAPTHLEFFLCLYQSDQSDWVSRQVFFFNRRRPRRCCHHESDAANETTEALWLSASGASTTTAGGACKWMDSTVATSCIQPLDASQCCLCLCILIHLYCTRLVCSYSLQWH